MTQKIVEKFDVKTLAILQVKDPTFFKGMMKSYSALASEVLWKVTKNELISTAMDLAYICLVNVKYAKADFDRFEVERECEFGINLEDWFKMLERAKKDEIIFQVQTYQIKEDKTFEGKKETIIATKYQVVCNYAAEETKRVRTYTIPCIDIEGEKIKVSSLDKMEFDNKFTINFPFLDDCIKDTSILSEVVEFICQKDEIRFTTNGHAAEYNQIIEKTELAEYDYTHDSDNIFSLGFLTNIQKSQNIFGASITSNAVKGAHITLYAKSEAPLKAEVKFLNESKITFFLAPRVEEDDESNEEEEDDSVPAIHQAKAEQKPIISLPILKESLAADLNRSDKKRNIIEVQIKANSDKAKEYMNVGNLDGAYTLLNEITANKADLTAVISESKEIEEALQWADNLLHI